MLPDVDCEERGELWADITHHILVLGLKILQLVRALVVRKPAPATALQSRRVRVEVLLEALHAAPFLIDQGAQLSPLVGQMSTAL